jgi:putative transposase
MPDHLHVLAYATAPDAALSTFVSHFKQTSGYAYKQAARALLWQSGYHERILRSDEETEAVAKYILGNPVRAGIATRFGAYPHAGSQLYDYSCAQG